MTALATALNGGAPETVTYGYDDAGQLVSEARPGTTIGYAYDANGNRTSKTLNGVTDSYAYGLADKLTSVTRSGYSKTYGYDANGNTTSINENGSIRTFSYDFENRVTSITGAYTASYSYNGAGTRVSKTEAGVTNAFKRDGAGVTAPVLADSYASYTPGVSERRGSVTKYMHSGIKSADVQTNASQTIDSSRKYDAFGAVLSSTNTWSGPFGNAGKFGYQEDPTGYQLLGHRYYDPSTGRFLTRDPIQDGRNWYVYCNNAPLVSYDANGLWAVGAGIGATAVPGVGGGIDFGIWIDKNGSVVITGGASFGVGVEAGAGPFIGINPYETFAPGYGGSASIGGGGTLGPVNADLTIPIDDGRPDPGQSSTEYKIGEPGLGASTKFSGEFYVKIWDVQENLVKPVLNTIDQVWEYVTGVAWRGWEQLIFAGWMPRMMILGLL